MSLVKLKKIQKSEKNSDYSDPTTHPIIQFFWNILKTWKQHKKHEKTQN